MRRSFIVGLCLSSCLTSPAAAESWFHIATTDNSIDYADADTIRSDGDLVSVDLFRGSAGEDDGPAYFKFAVEVTCAGRQFRIMRGVSYDLQRQYLATDETTTDWTTIAADSVVENLRRFTCDGALRDRPVSDPFDDADEYWYYYYES